MGVCKVENKYFEYKYIEYLKYSLYIKEASYKGWVYAKLNGATVPSRPLLNLPYQTQRWLRSGNVGPFESRFYNFIQKHVQKIGPKVIFPGSPLFLAVLGLCHFISISTLNFGPFSTKLGGTILAIKKKT